MLNSSSPWTRVSARLMAASARVWNESLAATVMGGTFVKASTASTARPPAVDPFKDNMIAIDCRQLLLSDSASEIEPVTRLSSTTAKDTSMAWNFAFAATMRIAARWRFTRSCSAWLTDSTTARSPEESGSASKARITDSRMPPWAPVTATAVDVAWDGRPLAARTRAA